MGKNIFYKIICIVSIVGLSFGANAQEKISKQLNEIHPLTSMGELFLDNKYGDVIINGWSKDSIHIVIDIEARGRDKGTAQELLNRIKPTILVTQKLVSIESTITEREASFFNKYFNKIDPFTNEAANAKVNYTIYLPKRAEVELHNKYGDVLFTDWNGHLKASVEHGDLRLLDEIENANLSVKHGKLKARSLIGAKIIAVNGDVDINQSNQLRLDATGSEIKLGTVTSLELYSNKDEIEIDSLKSVFGTIKYSTLILNNIDEKVNLNMNLAELKILKFNTLFPILTIDQLSSEIYINVSGVSFDLAAKLEQGVLRIPTTMKDVNTNIIDKKDKIRIINATYGTKGKGTLSFTGKKGVIILKEL